MIMTMMVIDAEPDSQAFKKMSLERQCTWNLYAFARALMGTAECEAVFTMNIWVICNLRGIR